MTSGPGNPWARNHSARAASPRSSASSASARAESLSGTAFTYAGAAPATRHTDAPDRPIGSGVQVPGSTDVNYLVIDWSAFQFALAAGVAMLAAMTAAYLPARRAAKVEPVDVLRGGT